MTAILLVLIGFNLGVAWALHPSTAPTYVENESKHRTLATGAMVFVVVLILASLISFM